MAIILRLVLGVLAIAVVGTAAAWWLSMPATPDDFYAAPDTLPPEPGTLIRSEPLTRGVPEGAKAWRILYTTTGPSGAPAYASAVVMTSADADATPRPVIAWAHGTIGIVPGCAPSMLADPFPNIPALADVIREKWIFVATDYVGLGSDGSHAYLIGESAARDVLNSVRAAHRMEGLNAAPKTVVWGHSQGGHAALWTGIRAPTYAPDANVVGVAAFAPASDLVALFTMNRHSMFGKIVSSYLSVAYAKQYPDIDMPSYISSGVQGLVNDIAVRCVGGLETLASVVETQLLPSGGIFMREPAEGPLGDRLTANTPAARIEAPVFIGQGETDDLVLPQIQAAFMVKLCETSAVDYRIYAGRDHISLVAPDAPLGSDLVAWTKARFAGEPAANTCPPLHGPSLDQ
jgi:pimeloyl-ACP methyl ester carboxylesterase